MYMYILKKKNNHPFEKWIDFRVRYLALPFFFFSSSFSSTTNTQFFELVFSLFFFFFFFFLQPFQLPGTSFAGHVSARIKIRPRTTSFEFGGEKDKEKKGSRGVEVGISARAVSKRGLQVSSETHSTREKL